MNFKDIFSNRKSKENLSQLVNLIGLAKADGNFSKEEIDTIIAIAAKKGISTDNFTKAMLNPEKVDYVYPKDEKTKMQFLGELIFLMLEDGKINENELKLCYLYARSLGYDAVMVNRLINEISAL